MDKIEAIKQFMEEDPNDPFLHFALAQEYEKRKNWEEALKKYSYLVQNHVDYVGTYYHYGKVLHQVGRSEEAADIYKSGIEIALQQGDHHSKSELEGALAGI